MIQKNVTKDSNQRRTHGYYINLVVEFTDKKKMSLLCSKKEEFFKFFLSNV